MQVQEAYQNHVSIAGRSNRFKVTHPDFGWTMFLLLDLLKGLWSSIYRNTENLFEAYWTRNQSLSAQIETLFPAISADT